MCAHRYLYTFSNNDVISSVRKHYCALGLGLELGLESRASAGQGGPWPFWIFIYDTEKEEGGLIVLFFGLVYSVAADAFSPGNFSK